jgi:uncharacterized protein (TIRG00374 family)
VKTSGREITKTALKLGLGGILIYYVLRSRMVDFKTLGTVLFNPVNLLVTLLFLSFMTLCCSARWYLLAKAQKLSLSFKDMVELTMIGSFFNTFMPGSVGGDLIKAWYVAGQEPTRKTKAVFTVLLDRVIGLAVIIFYAAFTLLFYTAWLKGHPELQSIALFIWSFTGLSVAAGILFFTPGLWNLRITTRIVGFLRRVEKLSKLLDAVFLYRHHLPTIGASLGLSALSIFATNLLYSIHGRTLGINLDIAHYFFIVPICVTVSAIPLLPGGIGVGQVAFFKVFEWTGVTNPEQGSTLCTVLQIYTILFNCTGAIFYLKFKKRPKGEEVATSSTSSSPSSVSLTQKRASPSL